MRHILVGNWKNFPNSIQEAETLISTLSKSSRAFKNNKISLFLAPPTPFLDLVNKKAKRFSSLAIQDLPISPIGTYTGEITLDMIKSFGPKVTILGHSERRALGESDEGVSMKARMALKAGMVPIICVGEEVHDHEGNYFQFLSEQIRASLRGVKKEEAKNVILAYEPVWAVGAKSKGSMDGAELAQMVLFIKKVLTEMFSRGVAEKMAIIYGGSVDENNAHSLLKQSRARGLLVGRVSLDAKKFIALAKSLAK